MAYNNPRTITYTRTHDFGAGSDALAIKGPTGMKGRIIDVGVMVTETFTADTTAGFVRLGTTTDADAYAELNMGLAADTDYWNIQDDTNAIISADLPANTQVEVALVAPTGGVPAGAGTVHIVVDWY